MEPRHVPRDPRTLRIGHASRPGHARFEWPVGNSLLPAWVLQTSDVAEFAMKHTLIALMIFACVPTVALAAAKKSQAPGPGQSEFAPGQQPGPAKKSAPGQIQKRTHKPAKKSAPGQQ